MWHPARALKGANNLPGHSRHWHRPPAPRASWPLRFSTSLRDGYATLDRPFLLPRLRGDSGEGPQNQGQTPKTQKSRKVKIMNEAQMTLIGNLVEDPEVRFTPAGQPVAKFRVASTPRYKDNATGEWKDGDSLFLTCTVWRQAAENVAESLQRGMRVIVTGRLKQRSYETKEGEKRTVYELEVDELGPSLRNASAKVQRVTRSNAGGQGAAAPANSGRDADPWATSASGGYSDEPPF